MKRTKGEVLRGSRLMVKDSRILVQDSRLDAQPERVLNRIFEERKLRV